MCLKKRKEYTMKNTKNFIKNSHIEDTEAETLRKMMSEDFDALSNKLYIAKLRERVKKAQMFNQLLAKK